MWLRMDAAVDGFGRGGGVDVAGRDVVGRDVAGEMWRGEMWRGRNGGSGVYSLCLWIGCRVGGCVRPGGILMRAWGWG